MEYFYEIINFIVFVVIYVNVRIKIFNLVNHKGAMFYCPHAKVRYTIN